MPKRSRASKILGILLAAVIRLPAQQATPPAEMTIAQAVEDALQNYPSIRVTQEQMNAAAAGIRLAQTAYLPRVDGLLQANRASRNTFYGLLLPQGIIPGVDGVKANNFGSVWDSGAGVLVAWQPYDFGLRRANVATAVAARDQARATLDRTRYEVSVATADAFLTVVAARQTAEAARAAVDSWQILQRSIHALVNAQLRPGADESRVAAELAQAQTQVAQAEQAIEVARATLGEFLGLEPSQVNPSPGRLLESPPDVAEAPLDAAHNPMALEQNAAIAQQQSRLDALALAYKPQFLLQGTVAGRGTGLETDGARLGGLNGLVPTVPNYGVGFTVTFPAMDRFAIREQEAMQAANVRAGQAQSQLIATKLQAQFNAALATLGGARRVASSTPRWKFRRAARHCNRRRRGINPASRRSTTWRRRNACWFRRRLTIDLARLNVWRARLEISTARGDIQPFLSEAVR